MNELEKLIEQWEERMFSAKDDADKAILNPLVKVKQMQKFMCYRDCIKELREVINNSNKKRPSIEEAKKELIEIFDSLEVWHDFKKYPNSLFWKKDGRVVMEFDEENNNLQVSYLDIWSIFESKYSLEYNEIKELIEFVVAKHWGKKEFTSWITSRRNSRLVAKHWEVEGVTAVMQFFNPFYRW